MNLAFSFIACAFCVAEAQQYYIASESLDSFYVDVATNSNQVEIISKLTIVDPNKIAGAIEQPCGEGRIQCEKRYDVLFKDGYTPLPGQEPYISFHNDKSEFRIIFFDEKYVELRSDTAFETHDDAGRRETDLKCCEYDGLVRHWILFGPYMAIYSHNCYGSYPAKSIYICDAPLDKSWVQSFKERDIDWHVKAELQFIYLREQPPRPKHRVRDFFSEIDLPSCPALHGRWWSKIFRCDDCDDLDTED